MIQHHNLGVILNETRKFSAILDIFYTIKLMEHTIEVVNDTTTKTAPHGAMYQMGNALDRIIYAYAETEEDELIFAAKEDVKDRF